MERASNDSLPFNNNASANGRDDAVEFVMPRPAPSLSLLSHIIVENRLASLDVDADETVHPNHGLDIGGRG
jgi:hypothetical protein